MQLTRTLRIERHYYGNARYGKPGRAVAPLDEARQELVVVWSGLPDSIIARQFSNVPPRMRHDMAAAGKLFLVEAATRFDFDRGLQFSTFASSWIRFSLLTWLESETRAWTLQLRPLIGGNGEADTDPLALAPAPVGDEPDGEDRGIILAAIARLTRRQQFVVTRRRGIGCNRRTLQSIGGTLGLTKERVRQIDKEAVAELKYILGAS